MKKILILITGVLTTQLFSQFQVGEIINKPIELNYNIPFDSKITNIKDVNVIFNQKNKKLISTKNLTFSYEEKQLSIISKSKELIAKISVKADNKENYNFSQFELSKFESTKFDIQNSFIRGFEGNFHGSKKGLKETYFYNNDLLDVSNKNNAIFFKVGCKRVELIANNTIVKIHGYNDQIIYYSNLDVYDSEGLKIPSQFKLCDNGFSIEMALTGKEKLPIIIDPIYTEMDPTSSLSSYTSGSFNVGFAQQASITGDFNGDGYDDVIVSSPLYDHPHPTLPGNISNTGAVYVFLGSASGLSYATYIPNDEEYGLFGDQIVALGDVDGNGFDDFAVTAPGNGSNAEGVVYVLGSTGTNFSVLETIEGYQMGGKYGLFITKGDMNGDGNIDLVIGDPYFDDNGYNGKLDLFTGDGTGSFSLSGKYSDANYGSFIKALSASGDINGDGYDDFLVTGSDNSSGQTSFDEVTIYLGQSSGLSSGGVIQPNKTWYTTAQIVGDLNDDNYAEIALSHSNDSVSVYYGKSSSVFNQQPSIITGKTKSKSSGAEFGGSIIGGADLDFDGYNEIIIGSRFFSKTTGNYEGAVLIFGGSSNNSIDNNSEISFISGNQQYSGSGLYPQFGSDINVGGDVNGDGHPDLLVSSYGYDQQYYDEGAFFLFIPFCDTDTSFEASSCEFYETPSGKIITKSQLVKDTIPNYNGCDSILYIDVSVFYSTDSSISIESCGPVLRNSGLYMDTSGNYIDTLINYHNCDSFVHISFTLYNDSIITQPVGYSGNIGDTFTLSVEHSSSNANYQWQMANPVKFENVVEDLVVTGSTSNVLLFTYADEVYINSVFRCLINHNICEDTSTAVLIELQKANGYNKLTQSNSLKIYPNPANRLINIDLNDINISDNLILKLIDLNGKLVFSSPVTNNEISLELNNLNLHGEYLINIETKSGKIVKHNKVIIN